MKYPPGGSDAEKQGLMRVFASRLIQHNKALMSAEEKLCIKVLRILQEMLIRTLDFDEKVSSISPRLKTKL